MTLKQPLDSRSVSVAKSIRDLLDRKGIPKKEHSQKLVEILNLSLSQVHRKLNGAKWELSQISLISDYFGEPYDSLNESFSTPVHQQEAPLIPATLILEGREYKCLVNIGAPLLTTNNLGYIAYTGTNDNWLVCEGSLAKKDVTYYKILKLELDLIEEHKLRVAVLDDDATGSADNLRDYLLEVGFHSEAFYDQETLLQVITEHEERQFDAFVVDWIINKTTSEMLIKTLRSRVKPDTPIFLLTGEISTGRALQSDVARIIVDYNVALHEKPTKMAIIAAAISKSLAR